MVIIFYNTKSIGDIFFAVPFIKFICEQNKNYEFQIHTDHASYLYKNVENLYLIDRDDNPHHHPMRYTISKFFSQYEYNAAMFDSQGNLFLNTWVGAMNLLLQPLNCECNLLNIYEGFIKIIDLANEKLEKKILFPKMNVNEMIFKMPPLKIDAFLSFKLNRNRQTIYYHNRMGQSAGTKPFTQEKDHIYILERLSKIFPEKDFIIPNTKIAPSLQNIFPTNIFGVIEDHKCENVIHDIDIAGNCDFAVVFDIGSSLLYCNDRFPSYTAKFLHASHCDRYPMLMKKNLEDCLSTSTNNIKYLHAKTPDELIRAIQSQVN